MRGWRTGTLSAVAATVALAAAPQGRVTVDYPLEGAVFPPEIVAPTFLFRDSAAAARFWRIEVVFGDGAPGLRAAAKAQRPRIGEIDPQCVAANNELPKLTPREASSWIWKPDAVTWAAIKKRSGVRSATVTFTGFASELAREPLSRGSVTIETSKDPVGAPVFYRDVPLMPAETESGIIKPLDQAKMPLIGWRLRNIGESRSRLLLTGMYTCANCHSFSLDGTTMGMDLDGPKNDKGMYTLMPVRKEMTVGTQDVIEWQSAAGKLKGETRVGFMSQVSPDGQYVVTMIFGTDPSRKGSLNNFYTANFKDYRFLQVFYPTRGILAWYSRATGELRPLPGADDPRYVHTNAVWSPDGKHLVFARAEAGDAYLPGATIAAKANDPEERQIRYDLYRIPFDNGKGGQPERIVGASQNGMSNSFPKVSPDGRWIVFVQCRNGQLMRPDSQLHIVPAAGGEARLLKANTPLMNSWHSFSPNGRWLVFSSKSRGPYTKMFLTHLDDEGNSSPAVLIEDATAANRAVNIPEFVNIPPDGLQKIDVPATDFYRAYNVAWEAAQKGRYDEAVGQWRKALELNPGEASVHVNIGVALARAGRPEEAAAEYRQALAIRPGDAETYHHLGAALADAGKFDEAIGEHRKAIELWPKGGSQTDLAAVYDYLGRALAGRGDMAGAILEIERATRLHPGFGPHLYDYALALTQVGRIEEAQQSVEAALKAQPDLVEARELRGGLLAKKKQFAEAAGEYRQALKLRPDLSRLHLALANMLAAQGDRAGVLQHLREAARGKDPQVAQEANRLLQQLGQR